MIFTSNMFNNETTIHDQYLNILDSYQFKEMDVNLLFNSRHATCYVIIYLHPDKP